MNELPSDSIDFDCGKREVGLPRAKLRPLVHATSSIVYLELSSYSDSQGSPNAQLRVSVHWLALLAMTVLVVGVLGVTILCCYGNGIRLGSFVSTDKTNAEKKALLDKYNSVSGSLATVALIPLELFVAMSVSVASLIFATDWMLRRGANDMSSRTATAIVASVITILLGNGLSALNVQLVSGGYHAKMIARDFDISFIRQDDQATAANKSLITTWNSSFAEASDGNSVLNTILRTKLVSVDDVQPTCNKTAFSPIRPPTVSFGFASRSWQLEILQTALSPDKKLEFALDNSSMSSLPNSNELPISIPNAKYLAVVASTVMPDMLSKLEVSRPRVLDEIHWGGGGLDSDGVTLSVDDLIYSYTGSNELYPVANLLNISTVDFIGSSSSVFRDMLGNSSNISIDDVRIGYKHLSISESVVVDALTLEIPTKPVPNSDIADDTANPTLWYIECSSEGCLAFQYFGEYSIDIQPAVYAAAVCIADDGSHDLIDVSGIWTSDELKNKTCPLQSNSSMLLIGLGKQIVGSAWDSLDGYANQVIQVRDIMMTYSVTVALLSWQIEDMTDVYSAECENDKGCKGVRTPLTSNSNRDVMIVGEAALPLEQLDYFSIPRYNSFADRSLMWRQLVSLSPPMNNKYADTLLLPRRFTIITEGGSAIRNTDPSNCDKSVDKYIKNVEKNHLYAEESLQMTYTAGFFFLFQDAVQHSPLDNSSSLLAFAGNTQQLNIQASIPTINIYISICGCVVLLVMSIGIGILHKSSAKRVEEDADIEMVAEALLNSEKYPPMILKMALEEMTTTHLDSQRISLNDLRIQLAEFATKKATPGSKTSEFTLMSSSA